MEMDIWAGNGGEMLFVYSIILWIMCKLLARPKAEEVKKGLDHVLCLPLWHPASLLSGCRAAVADSHEKKHASAHGPRVECDT